MKIPQTQFDEFREIVKGKLSIIENFEKPLVFQEKKISED